MKIFNYEIDMKNAGETLIAVGSTVYGVAEALNQAGVLIPGSRAARICAGVMAVGGVVARYWAHPDTLPNTPLVSKVENKDQKAEQ